MNHSITVPAPSAPVRRPDAAAPILEPDTPEQVSFWSSDDDTSFGDVLNAINPLQHIPVVSTIYRAVTGSTIGFGPRLIGAAILGGPIGLIIAGITAFFEEMSGGTVAEHAVALLDDLTGGDKAAADSIATAPGDAEGDAPSLASTAAAAQPAIPALAATPAQPAIPALAATPAQPAIPALAAAPAQPAIPALAAAPAQLPSFTKAPFGAARNGDGKPAMAPPEAIAMRAAVSMPNVVSVQNASILTMDTESKRISQTLLLAQRAQANLLLANLQAYDAMKSRTDDDEDRDAGEDRGAHTNLRPTGVGSNWYTDAMLRGLDKYRTDNATPTGNP